MTPIQRSVIPIITEGNDLMGCSQTGSGKTLAFLCPIVSKMLEEGPPKANVSNKYGVSYPVVLVLVPTRELAEQIYKEAKKLIHLTGIEVIKVYGGVPYEGQYADLRRGCDILIATPGRLIDFISKEVISLQLVKNFIIDEADRILEMGFADQLDSIVFGQGKY
jgi:superfamily II DNA/RNA helicase